MDERVIFFNKYVEVDGNNLIWKATPPMSRAKVGTAIRQSYLASGYKTIHISRKNYLVHQVVFAVTHGYIPNKIDHKDRDRGNNHPSNLRPASDHENAYNSKKTGSRSSFKGIHFCNSTKKWRVQIKAEGRRFSFGRYCDELEAAKVYDKNAIRLHGEFAYTNFPKENYTFEKYEAAQ